MRTVGMLTLGWLAVSLLVAAPLLSRVVAGRAAPGMRRPRHGRRTEPALVLTIAVATVVLGVLAHDLSRPETSGSRRPTMPDLGAGDGFYALGAPAELPPPLASAAEAAPRERSVGGAPPPVRSGPRHHGTADHDGVPPAPPAQPTPPPEPPSEPRVEAPGAEAAPTQPADDLSPTMRATSATHTVSPAKTPSASRADERPARREFRPAADGRSDLGPRQGKGPGTKRPRGGRA